MGKMIKALKVEPHKSPVPVELEDELEVLQDAVSIGTDERGCIELVGIDEGVDILLHEEGKLIGLEPNRRLGHDVLVGTFYVVGADSDTGELTSLNEEQMRHYSEVFAEPDEDITEEDIMKSIVMKFFFM